MSSIERCPLFGVSFIRGDMYVHVYRQTVREEAIILAACTCMCVLFTRG